MAQLSGKQTGQLSDALRDAFLPDGLDQLLLYALEIRREDLSLDGDYRARLYSILRHANAEGWVYDLVVAARDARPRNAGLQVLAAEFGLSSSPQNLERIIVPAVPFSDVGAWRARLGELECQVCRVEIPAGLKATVGTGFLVAPDLCLTNHHVVQPLIDKHAEPADVRLRFDFRRADDGTVVSEGTCFPLADDWLAASRPPSRADDDPAAGLPADDELDFALLRLAGEPGNSPAGRADQVPNSPPRGWIRSVGEAPEAGHPLSILQHPDGAPLKIAFGHSTGLNTNGTRLRYTVNTAGGSSGSPCLDAQLDLVGLHHAGDPNFDTGHQPEYNAAIPIRAITDYLSAHVGGIDLFPRPSR
jgi:hypothetical protein